MPVRAMGAGMNLTPHSWSFSSTSGNGVPAQVVTLWPLASMALMSGPRKLMREREIPPMMRMCMGKLFVLGARCLASLMFAGVFGEGGPEGVTSLLDDISVILFGLVEIAFGHFGSPSCFMYDALHV